MVHTFSAGVNTSFSSQLNANFADARHLTTRGANNTAVNTASTSWSDVLTVSTPAATKASQVVFLDAEIPAYCTNGADTMEIRLYDNTAAALVSSDTFGTNNTAQVSRFLQGTVTLTSVSDTKSIKLQIRRSAGSGGNVTAFGGRLVCQLVES